MKLYTTQRGIVLNEQTLGSGAEGNVYEVVSPVSYKHYVAKIYHSQELKKDREPKIKRLIASGLNSDISSSIIFPKECIYNEKGDFMGFIMPKINAPYHLTSLCSLSLPHNIPELWYNKYTRTSYNLYFRLLICKNLAKVVANLHATNQYIFADLKPENIKVNVEGKVFILDIDSIQITNSQQQLLYPTEKVTPEYAPQEIKKLNFKEEAISESWDRFSLGVIFYKILLGLHPYTGTCLPPYENLVSNEQKIQANLLPLGDQAHHFDIIPAPHHSLEQLPQRIQTLLMASFKIQPKLRPTAAYWHEILAKELCTMKKPIVKKQKSTVTTQEETPARKGPLGLSLPTNANKAHRDVTKLVAINITAFAILMALVKFVTASSLFTQQPTPDFLARQITTEVPVKIEVEEPKYRSKGKLNRQNQKYGLIDNKGKLLLPYDYEWVGTFSEGLASIVLRTKTGYIDENGKIIIPLVYDEGWAFKYGVARVSIANKMAMIDKKGKLLIPLYYDGLWDFDTKTKGLARIEKDGKYGFINQQGKVVIDLQFDWANDFAGKNTTKVKVGNTSYTITRSGKVLIK